MPGGRCQRSLYADPAAETIVRLTNQQIEWVRTVFFTIEVYEEGPSRVKMILIDVLGSLSNQSLSGSMMTLIAAGSLAATSKASATREIGKRWVMSGLIATWF